MANVTSLWSSTYKIVKGIKLFKKITSKDSGRIFYDNYNLLLKLLSSSSSSSSSTSSQMERMEYNR